MKVLKWKLSTRHTGSIIFRLPVGSKIISVGIQEDIPRVWALVPDVQETIQFQLMTIWTGWTIPKDIHLNEFIGTVQNDDGMAFHIWRVTS